MCFCSVCGGNGIVLRPSLKLLWRWQLKQYLLSSTASLSMWNTIISVQFSRSIASDYLRHHGLQHARPPCPSPTPGVYSNSCPLSQWCHPTIHPLSSPSPPAFNLSQYQGLFKWVSSSHQVAQVLELQLQHQSFQWTFRTDFLSDGLVGSPCSPRGSQESTSTPLMLQKHKFFSTQLSL